MRQYLYVFWALVLGGMVLLTGVYPPGSPYADYRHYRIYDRDGNMTLISSHDYAKSMNSQPEVKQLHPVMASMRLNGLPGEGR